MEVNNCREIKARYLLIMSNFRSCLLYTSDAADE